jgi:hypothetical protein
MKVFIIFLSLATLVGCASKRIASPPASNFEKREAVTIYSNCLVPYVQRLDDGRSDAKTIVYALKAACQKELRAVYETASRGENNAVKEMMWQRMGSLQDDLALQVVLRVRHAQTE